MNMEEDDRLVSIQDEDGNEYRVEKIAEFDSKDGLKHFVLIKDPADEDEDRAADQLRRTAEAAAYSLTAEHSSDHGKHGHNEDGGEVHHHLAGRD